MKTIINKTLNWFWSLSLKFQLGIVGILTILLLFLLIDFNDWYESRSDKKFDEKIKKLEDRNRELEKVINEKSGEVSTLQKQLEETRKELQEVGNATNVSKKKYYRNRKSIPTTSPSLDNEVANLRTEWDSLYGRPEDNK